MITLTKAWGVPNANILGFSGKSTDVKPIGKYEGMSITNGSEYKEIDTGNTYSYDAEGSSWYLNNTTTSGEGSGANGITPHIGENGNWFIGSTDTGVSAEGENGGYYIPAVSQPSSDKLQISFAPSKSDMPAVNPVTVNLPVSENSGQNLTLDTTLTQSGKAADAKATGDEIKRVEGKIPSIEGLAKTEDIPTKPEDIGAQPQGNYASPDDIPEVPSWAMQASKPAYTASEVGADTNGTAASAVSTHNTNTNAHPDIRQELAAINARLTAFFDSDNQTLDELSEIVAYITSNKSLIDAITTSKVSVADIINNLNTNVANKPLSAAQGVAIKSLIDGLSASLADYQPKGNYALASAVPTKVSQLQNDAKYLTAVTAAMITEALGYTPINPGLATLARHADGLLYLFVNGKPVGSGVELPTGGIDGYITADKQVIFNNLPDGKYTLAYINDDGDIVPIGAMEKDTNVYYSVTQNLTNCTNSNSATKAVQGGSYSATITAVSGYELKSVTVTMGGSPVTVSGGVINITNVTGNIVITAVAEEKVVTPSYTNFADPTSADWKTGYRLSGDINGTAALTGGVVTNYVSVQQGDTLEVTGINISDSNSRTAFRFDSTNNSIMKPTALTNSASISGVSYDANSLICTVAASCDSDAKMRFSGLATGTSEDVVIKIKRNGAYL